MITELPSHDVGRFHEDGFVIVERLIDDDDLATIRAAYDELLDDHGRAAGDRMLGGLTRQIMSTSETRPLFRDNAPLEAGRRIGRQPVDALRG